MQISIFAHETCLDRIDRIGDSLSRIDEATDWEIFRKDLESIRDKERKSAAGRKPWDAVLMFKILILAALYNLSDEAAEYQIADRLSFQRFVGIAFGEAVPDARTIWLFRSQLTEAGLIEKLFERFEKHLRENGYSPRKGQIVDASIMPVPVQRNTREENRKIKEGETPEEWEEKPAKLQQKDTDARWTKKNGKSSFGYKNHVSVDVKHKLIRKYEVTDASVHDGSVIGDLLDENNTSRDVWADSAYRSRDRVKQLTDDNWREHLQRKGCRGRKLTERERQGNKTRSRIRSRVEHVFGVQARRAGGKIVRAVGKARVSAKIGLRNLAYNIDRHAMLQAAKA